MQVGRRDVILRIASFEWGSPDRFSAAGRYLDDADDPGDERDVRSWPSVSTCTVGDDWTRVPR